jgi:flagellar hook-length control protein FliK
MARRTDDPAWGDELGERVVWLIGRRESLAELRLNPPELGSLEIRIRQEKDAASIHILVQSGTAREALESALPRLRELFGEAGLSLQRLDVAERQAGQSGEGGRDGTPGGPPSPSDEHLVPGELSRRPAVQAEGLIDTYA